MKKVTAGKDALGEFAPLFARLNDDVLFGEVWSREEALSPKIRSILTVAALTVEGVFDSSVEFHMRKAKENGVSGAEIAEILTHLAFYAGWPKAWAAFRLAKNIWTEKESGAEALAARSLFPIGKPNTAYEKYFKGRSYTEILSGGDLQVVNVTFEPACRNNWHIHKAEKGGGQLLLCVSGRGWYREWGAAPVGGRHGGNKRGRQALARRCERQLVFAYSRRKAGTGLLHRMAGACFRRGIF